MTVGDAKERRGGREDEDKGVAGDRKKGEDGEQANVGSPLGKTFMKFSQDGTLTSPGDEAKEALDMNSPLTECPAPDVLP